MSGGEVGKAANKAADEGRNEVATASSLFTRLAVSSRDAAYIENIHIAVTVYIVRACTCTLPGGGLSHLCEQRPQQPENICIGANTVERKLPPIRFWSRIIGAFRQAIESTAG